MKKVNVVNVTQKHLIFFPTIPTIPTMSVVIHSSFQKSPAHLGADERPICAVKIMPRRDTAVARRNFHLGLLIDTSGSMDGERITTVKTTLRLLIDALVDGDVLTIIGYESMPMTVARGKVISAESRPVLRTSVDSLRATGGTNLEAALVLMRDITSDTTLPVMDAAFVLTDGHINQGLTSASGLIRILNAAIPSGTPVYTLGFGADHNSRMLRDIALRTRGSYTYADAAELIPATIADIISGLANEVGRGSRLIIPSGWRCLELTTEEGAAEFNVGVLIADKEQMVVLEGPSGPCVDVAPLTFVWHSPDGIEHTETCTTYNDFDSVIVYEQYCRCRVATVQTAVHELLEAHNITEARTALSALGTELDRSPAKDRSFVIGLRAQIDEMLDVLSTPPAAPSPLQRVVGGIWGPTPVLAPSIAPMISRMASNTAALGVQRGIISHVNSIDPSHALPGAAVSSGITHTFNSPAQRQATQSMTERYSRVVSSAVPEADDSIERTSGIMPLQRMHALTHMDSTLEP